MLTLPLSTLAQRIIDHPDNAQVLEWAAEGRAGPAEAYVRPSQVRLYPAFVVVFTAKSPYSQELYLSDLFGKLWTWDQPPKILLGISQPDLSTRSGRWQVTEECAA